MKALATKFKLLGWVLAMTGLATSGVVQAQTAGSAFLEEIIVTATKRAGGISVQDAAVAVTAYSDDQIDKMFLRDLKAIGFSAPNVQLEDIGTARGTANFSIRGLGINSSIPSIDPTVGVFVDGMYLGLNAGVVFDTFDLEGVEVLRGPQGLLFGRNVTGGAVLLRTTRPTDEFSVNARVAYESGDNQYASAVVAGPLGDTVGFKLAGYVNSDGGWFDNLGTGNDSFGQADTTLFRGAISWQPTDSFDLIIRAEHGDSNGDGPASQNAGIWGTETHEFAIDEEGFYDNDWNQVIGEATFDVSFGDGQIVDIMGWREYNSNTTGDIDATPTDVFHAPAATIHDQFSNELRYNGTFGKAYLTTGIYYFTQEVDYREQRDLFKFTGAGPTFIGGGVQKQDTSAIFAQVDYAFSDLFTMNFGGRYTSEKKDAKIATIFVPAVTGSGCTIEDGCDNYDFVDDNSWTSFTPKIGFQMTPNEDTQFYGFWTKGFRSGGYNLRHTSLTDPNEGFDQEEQNSVEIGIKKDFNDGRLRVNVAGFYNEIDNMQREVNLPSAVAGVVQLVKNTADAKISGFEFELSWAISDQFFTRFNVGYVHGNYTEVRFDLNGDGVVDDADRRLSLPRLAPWSYGLDLIWDHELSFGGIGARLSAYHRDAAAYTDNNLGNLRESDTIDLSLNVRMMDDRLTLSAFGRNLTDEVTIGGDTQLPASFGVPGGTFSPLNKGRTVGVEVQYRY